MNPLVGTIQLVTTGDPAGTPPGGFRDGSAALADPSTVTLTWRVGNGTPTVWVYGTDIQVVRDSVGQYHADVANTVAGTYTAVWTGTGAVTAVGEVSWTVEPFSSSVFTGAYCTATDVFTRLGGDVPTISLSYAGVVGDKCNEVSGDINRMISRARGCAEPWSFVADAAASVRTYTGKPGPIRLLPIDDAFSLTSVALYSRGLLQRTLIAGTDYVTWPSNGLPITGLLMLTGVWPEEPGSIQVTGRWGYGLVTPVDVREAAIIEVIRSYLSDQGGNNDSMGVTPWGAVISSKAFTSKLFRLVNDYGHGGGFMRAGG